MAREGKAKVLTDKELKRLIAITTQGQHAKRNLALLYVSFGLGLRAKEMTALNVHHVLNTHGEIHEECQLTASMTKGAQARMFYLTNPNVRKALSDYLAERREKEGVAFNYQAPLFRSQKSGRFSPNTLQKLFHQLFEQAGLLGASSHSGRRTFATRLIEKGIDIKAVSKLMGHRSIAMTAQYVEDNPLRLRKIAKELSL